MDSRSIEKDARNKLLIATSLRGTITGARLSEERFRLIHEADAAERAVYVDRKIKFYINVCVIIFAIVFLLPFLPSKPAPKPVPPTFTYEGSLKSLQLHKSTFSTSTTVVTDTGTFQVLGAVSAAIGDGVTLKRVKGSLNESSICVESSIKNKCYDLL